MEEAYRANVRRVMDQAGWHWPEHLLLDPARGPRFLSSAAELLHEWLQGHGWLAERRPDALLNAERRPNSLLDQLQALGSAQANG